MYVKKISYNNKFFGEWHCSVEVMGMMQCFKVM